MIITKKVSGREQTEQHWRKDELRSGNSDTVFSKHSGWERLASTSACGDTYEYLPTISLAPPYNVEYLVSMDEQNGGHSMSNFANLARTGQETKEEKHDFEVL